MDKIKRTVQSVFITICVFLMGTTGFAAEAPALVPDPIIIVENKKIESTAEIVVTNAYTLVPLRPIADALGYTVYWNSETDGIVLSKVGSFIELRLGSNRAVINGETKLLSIVPRMIEGTAMVPLQFVSDGFGKVVSILENYPVSDARTIWISDYKVMDLSKELAFAQQGKHYQRLISGDKINILEYRIRPEGETAGAIFIGMPYSNVVKKYGASEAGGDTLTYLAPYQAGEAETTARMQFTFEEGKVSDIKIILDTSIK